MLNINAATLARAKTWANKSNLGDKLSNWAQDAALAKANAAPVVAQSAQQAWKPGGGYYNFTESVDKYPTGNPELVMSQWEPLLRAAGFKGNIFNTVTYLDPARRGRGDYSNKQVWAPDAKEMVDKLRAAGYDIRNKDAGDTFNSYWGVVTPQGVYEYMDKGNDLSRDFLGQAALFFGAANIGSLLGGASGAAGAAGIAEGMAPGLLAAATPAELAAVNAIASAPSLLSAAAPTIADAVLPSIAEGMAPGVLTAASPAELAAVGALTAPVSAPGLLSVADGMVPGVTAPATAEELAAVNDIVNGSAGSAGLSRSDRALLNSNEGYGPGMSGTQTSVYDTVLDATGSKQVADLAANVVGTGADAATWLKDNPKTGQALFSAGGALLNTAGSSGSGGGYTDSGWRPTLSDRQRVSKQKSMPITPVSLILPTTGQANSGLWRYGLLGG